MMVTDNGRLIRVPVHDVRIAGRNTQGVTLFKVGDEEQIVSVDRIHETEDDEEAEDGEGEVVEETSEDEITPEE